MADPASVGVIIGAAPLVIVTAAAIAAGRRPTRRVLLAAAVATAGSAAAQLGGATGATWNAAGLLWSAGALGGVVGATVLAAPVLSRLGALAVTVYSCGLAGLLLAAVAPVGTGTVTPLRLLGALAVLAGVILGLPGTSGSRALVTVVSVGGVGEGPSHAVSPAAAGVRADLRRVRPRLASAEVGGAAARPVDLDDVGRVADHHRQRRAHAGG